MRQTIALTFWVLLFAGMALNIANVVRAQDANARARDPQVTVYDAATGTPVELANDQQAPQAWTTGDFYCPDRKLCQVDSAVNPTTCVVLDTGTPCPTLPRTAANSSGALLSAQALPASLAGVYRVVGANPDGREYIGILELAASPDAFVYQGRFLDPGGAEYGVRMIWGGADVAFAFTEAGTYGVYRWNGRSWDGQLSGWGKGFKSTETLTPTTTPIDVLIEMLNEPKVAL